MEGTLPLHGPRALIVRIKECNYQSAAQSLDRDQEIGSELFTMFGQEMSLDVTWTRPLERAKQAVAPLLVYVLPMPCELLCTPKALVAVGTDTPRLAVHLTSVLDSHMLSCSEGPILGCDDWYSDHRKRGDTYPVCRQIGFKSGHRLDGSSKCSHLCMNVVEVQR